MAKVRKEYDAEGVKLTMRTRDYLADMSGQLALGLMANLVGQLQYFYTDKVGMAVGSVGVVMAIAKIVDALTDVIFGNIVDHSRGGNKKYFRWMISLAVPAAAIVALLFMIPANAASGVKVAYALITNLLLTAVIYTMIATPFSAVMVVRTKSNSERSSMGIFRAVGNYGAGMIIAIATIPVTNLLGGTQSAWIKYGVVLALAVLLLFLICWLNGHKAAFTREEEREIGESMEPEEEAVPFGPAMSMLFKNKYWVIVLLFNLITNITNAIVGSAGTYYCKWIFGNDNLVGILGAVGLVATALGFALSKPIINKLGVTRTVSLGCLGAAFFAGLRCFAPTSFYLYVGSSLLGSFIQIPLMCLYGVLLAMAVDYNEWKYDKKLVAMSGGAIGFGAKVGGGLGSLLLSAFLIIGSYDASLAVASQSMRWSIYGFSNYLPVVINLLMYFIFRGFDLEQKLPALRAEVETRKAGKSAE
ncbi:MAG: MFS transporter [Oscillospiraceae bacterium]|nr:MFS transporter [Oscillospiraceae bacterium]